MKNSFSSHFNVSWLNKILVHPNQSVSGRFLNIAYEARVVIPDYKFRMEEFYKNETQGSLDNFCVKFKFPKVFKHFGLCIEFKDPIELRLHDEEMEMEESIHSLIKEIGAVIIKNAHLDSVQRSLGHRNRFPQLNFHVDRSENQPTHYSMYTRDPFDEEQKQPRNSSTLFVASVLGHLQSIKEKTLKKGAIEGNQSSYTIFSEEVMEPLLNNIVMQHAWDEPAGTGEISIIDNTTCLHASYYPNPFDKGYKIGVRYVS